MATGTIPVAWHRLGVEGDLQGLAKKLSPDQQGWTYEVVKE